MKKIAFSMAAMALCLAANANIWYEYGDKQIMHITGDTKYVSWNDVKDFHDNCKKVIFEDGESTLTIGPGERYAFMVGYHWTGIFSNMENLTEVYLGRNIEYGYYVIDTIWGIDNIYDSGIFYNSNKLSTITIGPKVKYVPKYLFNNCMGVSTIDFSNATSLARIDTAAFKRNNLTELTLPASLTFIGNDAFDYYSSENIIKKVTLLGNDAYKDSVLVNEDDDNFQNATTVIIDKNIKMSEEGTYVFASAKNVTFGSHCTKVSKTLFNGTLETLDLSKSSIVEIEDGAFYNCDGLTSTIVFPSTLTTLGLSCFADCDGEGFAADFSACTSLQKMTDYAFSNCTNMASVILPPNLVTIEREAFYRNSFTEVTIPASVVYIGDDAFDVQGSSNDITKVTFLGNESSMNTEIMNVDDANFKSATTVIMDHAIQGINNETVFPAVVNLTVGEHCGTIGAYICQDNDDLKNITLPSSLALIREYAFENCDEVEQIICRASTPPVLEEKAWYNMSGKSSMLLKVPSSSVNSYKAVDSWKEFNVQPLDAVNVTTSLAGPRTIAIGGAYQINITVK